MPMYESDGLPEWSHRMTHFLEHQTERLATLLDHAWAVAFGAIALAGARDIVENQPNVFNVALLGGCTLLAAKQALSS